MRAIKLNNFEIDVQLKFDDEGKNTVGTYVWATRLGKIKR